MRQTQSHGGAMAGLQPTARPAAAAGAAAPVSRAEDEEEMEQQQQRQQQQRQQQQWQQQQADVWDLAAGAGSGASAAAGGEGGPAALRRAAAGRGGRGGGHAGGGEREREAAGGGEPLTLDLQAPLSAVHVRVEGLKKLKLSRIADEIEPLRDCRSVGELLSCLETTHRRLEELRLFSHAVSEVHCSSRSKTEEKEEEQQQRRRRKSSSSSRVGEEAAPEAAAVDVLLRLQEKRASYVVGTYVDARGDVELEANAHVPAFLGGRETFSISAAATPISSNTRLRLNADVLFPTLPLFLCRSGAALQQLLLHLREAAFRGRSRSSSNSQDDRSSSSGGAVLSATAAAAAAASSAAASPSSSSETSPFSPHYNKRATAAAADGNGGGGAAAAVALRGSGGETFFGLRRGVLRAFSSQTSWAACSSFLLQQTGIAARLLSSSASSPQQHAVEWSLTLRDVLPCCDATKVASAAVLTSPLRSLKHGLRYDFTLNRLDVPAASSPSSSSSSPQQQQQEARGPAATPQTGASSSLLPRQGYLINANIEAAGPGGDTRFVKAEVHGFAATPVHFSFRRSRRISSSNSSRREEAHGGESPWVLSGRVGCGVLLPGGAVARRGGGRGAAQFFQRETSSCPFALDSPAAAVEESAAAAGATATATATGLSVCDRFRLTGPCGAAAALRGFRSYCVGPADTSHVLDPATQRWRPSLDFLGGDTFLSSEICLSYDLQLPSFLRAASSPGGRSVAGGASSGVHTPEARGESEESGVAAAAAASPPRRHSAFHPRLFFFGNVGTLGDVFSTSHLHYLQGPPAAADEGGIPAAGGEADVAATGAAAAGGTGRVIRLLQQRQQAPPVFPAGSSRSRNVREAAAAAKAAAAAAAAGERDAGGGGGGGLQRVSSNLWRLLQNFRCAVGWGIALPVSKGIWIEGLVALPLRAAAHDETQRIQVGLRLASAGMTGD